MKKGFLMVALGIVILAAVGVFVATRHRAKADQITLTVEEQKRLVCPPRPLVQPGLVVSNYYEGTGRISFNATADIAEDVKAFGSVSDGFRGGYDLYMDARYDFQEVLDYLNSWNECHDTASTYIGAGVWIGAVPTSTPTLEPGRVNIAVGQALYGAIDGDKCYADIPLCGNGLVCPVEYGREVPCGDWLTPTPTATPTPTPIYEGEIDIDAYIDEWLNSDIWLTEQYSCLPQPDDVLYIDWPYTILVTDAFSQTLHLKGPATVRFSEEGE